MKKRKIKKQKIFHLWELFSLRRNCLNEKAPTKARFFIFYFLGPHIFTFYVMYVPCTQSHTYTAHLCLFFLLLFTYTAHIQHKHLHIFHPRHSDVSHTMWCQFQPSDKFCLLFFFLFLFFLFCLIVCVSCENVLVYWCWVCVGSKCDICGCVWMCVNPIMKLEMELRNDPKRMSWLDWEESKFGSFGDLLEFVWIYLGFWNF